MILAVLMGLSVLAASVQPPVREREDGSETGRTQPSPSPAAPEEQGTRSVTLAADEPRRRVMVDLGRPLHLEVTAPEPGSVQVGVDGPIAPVQPESPARFDLLPDRAGTIEVVLLDPRRVIGRITTRR